MKKFLLMCAIPLGLCCCQKVQGPQLREEYINVFDGDIPDAVDNVQIPFEGVENGQLHIRSNVPLQWKYMVDQDSENTAWFNIREVKEVEPGHMVVTYDAESILDLNSLDRREGKLSFSCPSRFLGKFMDIAQGYPRQFLEEFDGQSEDNDLVISGKRTYTTKEYPVLGADYYDYVSFNAWADADPEFLSRNITLDIKIDGAMFNLTARTTYRVNVPLGTQAGKDNFKFFLISNGGERLSPQTKFTFSTQNDDGVIVHVDNFAGYKVTPAEMRELMDDEEIFDDDGGEEWI